MHAILIAKDEGLARALVLALAGMDIRISIFGEVEALRKSVHCDGFFHLPIDGSDESANRFAALANEIVDRQADTVIIPADVPSCLTMLAARSKLRCAFFPAPEPGLLEEINDKWPFYGICNKYNVPTPKTVFVGSKTQCSYSFLSDALSGPFVLKPTCERNGDGVVVIRSEEEYRELILENSLYQYSPLIAQQYVPGKDIDISLLAYNGEMVCCAVQTRTGSVVNFLECEALRRAAGALVEGVHYTGVLHIDARQHQDTGFIWLIEANPRIWGTINAAKWCGLNFIAAGIALACNRPVTEPRLLIDGCYPGFASALKSRLLGQIDSTKMGKERRSFINQLMFDPYEYYRVWDRMKSLPLRRNSINP
jgi:biotin carboxylase